ncbi:Fe-only nitrogenase accessory AnfO family protein [Desulforamulus ferrireducens]|uniref:Nitrogenase n=1 Tax=Desulforamulus ferrireducens TaxID=1833852 RepID=A0A1S6IX85_9FIRM|nr:Fe-only nitrogenase accessory AnfO family protein [Desulforamulus ferrireducens]AQS59389.1 nitrogenase [Desulforamulus ferrireducens]
MSKEIAFYVGEDGQTTSLYEQGKVVVYQRNQGSWSIAREKEFDLGKTFSIKVLRDNMQVMIDFLGSCKTMVGRSISGIPYYALEKARCNIWEYEGNPTDFLDYFVSREAKTKESTEQPKQAKPPAPVEIMKDCYRISLKEIQEQNMGYTSKQVLLPFLRQEEFYSLEVICNHIPPWLAGELLVGDLESTTEAIGSNEYKITIRKKCCQQT